MFRILQLSGSSKEVGEVPTSCSTCSCTDFYQQADFKRSIGVGLMVLASVLTCVLLYFDFGWWTVWSPMFILLGLDLILRKSTSTAVICYQCGLIHRGISKDKSLNVEGFDLERFDRIQYQNRNAET